MSQRDPSESGDAPTGAEAQAELPKPPAPPPPPPPPPPPKPKVAGTIMGVAPPRVEATPESPLRKPVFVRSGTSADGAGDEPPPLPRMALPSRPLFSPADLADLPAPFDPKGGFGPWLSAMLKLPVRAMGGELKLWMLAGPVALGGVLLVALLASSLSGGASQPAPAAGAAPSASVAAPEPSPAALASAVAKPSLTALSELEGKSPDSMSSKELVELAEARAEKQRARMRELSEKLESNPALAKEKAQQLELLHFAADAETARAALLAMSKLEGSLGADLLYEVWTGTTAKTDATELARALVYSTDVRPKASPALAVALDLRVAEKCEQFQPLLPRALKDGDKRSLHLLTKLTAKRGCGPKKNEDCFACLRASPDELTATINAVKSRRPPSYPAR